MVLDFVFACSRGPEGSASRPYVTRECRSPIAHGATKEGAPRVWYPFRLALAPPCRCSCDQHSNLFFLNPLFVPPLSLGSAFTLPGGGISRPPPSVGGLDLDSRSSGFGISIIFFPFGDVCVSLRTPVPSSLAAIDPHFVMPDHHRLCPPPQPASIASGPLLPSPEQTAS